MLFNPAHRRIVIHLHIDYCTLVEILHVQESRQFTTNLASVSLKDQIEIMVEQKDRGMY